MTRLAVIAATALAIALGWAWWESTRPVQWKGGWR